MVKNFFKIAFRNLLRSKGFSAINIIGLSIGMASAILILLWIQNEVSYDQFHEKKDRIYEAWNRGTFDGVISCWNNTPKPLARALQSDLPEVEQTTRVNWPNTFVFSIGQKKLFVQGNQVDSNFLQVFSFPLKEGDRREVLKERYSIVVTETLAKKLFGNEEAMGKMVKINGQGDFRVTGVLKDLSNNTRFDFEYLLPWSNLRQSIKDDDNWSLNTTRTYVLLRPNSNLTAVETKMKTFRDKYDQEAKKNKWQMFLYPISRWRLHSEFKNGYETSGGRITIVKLFGTIAAFILLIACINFMNLSTARSEKRAKEVGIRKVVGALKGSLISQFLGESILLAFIAGILSLIIVQLSIPAFNQLVGKNLFIPFSNISFWLGAVGFVLLTGFLAGSYPAFFLSSFRPVEVLKGTFKKANAVVKPRQVLVVLQFTFAIVLIICTIIVKQQIDYAKERQSGYNKSNLIYSYLSADIEKNYLLIKGDLLRSGTAVAVTKTSSPLTQDWNDQSGQVWDGKDPNDPTAFTIFSEDGGLGKTAVLSFVEGRDIDIDRYPTDSLGIILNESALKVMRFKNPIGKIIGANGQQWHVVGVIADFILSSPYESIKPMLLFGPKSSFSVIQIKLNENNTIAQNLKMTEAVFKKYDPEYLFKNNFVDLEYAAKFEDEERTATLAGLFASLTIFVSCLGLLGLASSMAATRKKEIGVRKVLGASVLNITTLLSKEFAKLVMIATLIASPIAWFAMHKWLESYSYRIDISLLVFLVSGVFATAIALSTISYQAIKSASANPVKSLKQE